MSLLESITAPIVEAVRAEAEHLFSGIEEKARRAVNRFTRIIRFTLAEFALWSVAAGLFFAGIIVFLTRFFPADAVLIGTAFLLSYVALLIRMLR